MSTETLFGQHLDLAPLRGRRRGLVHCPFHPDRSPSLSVDLDKEIFHCFGCGVSGGVKRFAELLGQQIERPSRPRPRPDRLARWRPIFELNHYVKKSTDLADRVRREATRLGLTAKAWDLLAEAAKLETAAHLAEAESDEMVAEMRRQ